MQIKDLIQKETLYIIIIVLLAIGIVFTMKDEAQATKKLYECQAKQLYNAEPMQLPAMQLHELNITIQNYTIP